MKKLLPLLLLATSVGGSHAANISLASTMDPSSWFTDTTLSAAFAQISQGNGLPGDADGFYNFADPNFAFGTPFGSGSDIFPNEGDFSIGSFEIDGAGVSGSGIETVSILSLDIDFSSDISFSDLSSLFGPVSSTLTLSFGALDASDTATFTDGLLTSVDFSVDATLNVNNAFLGSVDLDGTFSASGDSIALFINEVVTGLPTPPLISDQTEFTADLDGTILSVGTFTIPEPSTSLLALATVGFAAVRRRRH
ncbi:MAG: PEP-CTERM sorting domain-containing protein [Verrucomicrobiota bacterium]